MDYLRSLSLCMYIKNSVSKSIPGSSLRQIRSTQRQDDHDAKTSVIAPTNCTCQGLGPATPARHVCFPTHHPFSPAVSSPRLCPLDFNGCSWSNLEATGPDLPGRPCKVRQPDNRVGTRPPTDGRAAAAGRDPRLGGEESEGGEVGRRGACGRQRTGNKLRAGLRHSRGSPRALSPSRAGSRARCRLRPVVAPLRPPRPSHWRPTPPPRPIPLPSTSPASCWAPDDGLALS